MTLHAEQPNPSGWFSHLLELRARLLRAVLALLLVFVCLLPFARDIFTLLAAPLLNALPQAQSAAQLVAISPLAPFTVPLRLSFYLALLLAMPFALYQAWAFVAPGLYRHERRLAIPLLICAVVLFYAGFAFAYFALLPLMFEFLLHMNPDGVALTTDIGLYLDFVLIIAIACGLAFQVPIAVFVLVSLHLVNTAQLAHARGYVVIALFALAMLITPGDGLSMLVMGAAMWLLYEAGLFAARMLEKTRHSSTNGTAN